jgi:hypothetical protein
LTLPVLKKTCRKKKIAFKFISGDSGAKKKLETFERKFKSNLKGVLKGTTTPAKSRNPKPS